MEVQGEGQARVSGLQEDAYHQCLHTHQLRPQGCSGWGGGSRQDQLQWQIRGDVHHWGARALGPKSVAPTAKLEKARVKEQATKLGWMYTTEFFIHGSDKYFFCQPRSPTKKFFFGCVTYGILVLQLGMEIGPPTLEAQSPNHWTAREVPRNFVNKVTGTLDLGSSEDAHYCGDMKMHECYVSTWMGGEFEGAWIHVICMTESLCYPPETVTTLLIGYTSIQNNKFNKTSETNQKKWRIWAFFSHWCKFPKTECSRDNGLPWWLSGKIPPAV